MDTLQKWWMLLQTLMYCLDKRVTLRNTMCYNGCQSYNWINILTNLRQTYPEINGSTIDISCRTKMKTQNAPSCLFLNNGVRVIIRNIQTCRVNEIWIVVLQDTNNSIWNHNSNSVVVWLYLYIISSPIQEYRYLCNQIKAI